MVYIENKDLMVYCGGDCGSIVWEYGAGSENTKNTDALRQSWPQGLTAAHTQVESPQKIKK